MTDDVTLLRRYADTRAEEAFAELVRRHLDGVYSAALRRVGGDTHLAEDVTQQVFAALARKADTVARHPTLSGWLYTTTRNEAANTVRSERRRKARDQEAHVMHDTSSIEPRDADWSRVAPMLDEVIDSLVQSDRQAVLLRFIDRRPFAEIGATLRISEDAARMRVDRALEKLRVLLARRGVGSTSTALGMALTHHAVIAAPAGLAASVTGAALTSSVVTSGPVAIAFQFMTTSKLVTIGAAAVLAVAIGTATYETRSKHAVTVALNLAAADAARLGRELHELRVQAAVSERTLQELQTGIAMAQAEKAPRVQPRPAGVVDQVEAGRELLARRPEVRELWDERERANIAAKFGPLFRMLDIGTAEQEELTNIAMQSMAGGTFVNGPDGLIMLRREPSLPREEAETQMQRLLGPEKYARFQELAPIAPTFDLTVKLATALYRTEPLSPVQTERVMQIFADASPVGKGLGKPAGPGGIDWKAIAVAATEVLSPRQVDALDVVRKSFEYQQAVHRIGQAATASSNPSAGVRHSR
jgi:RNA polymerase sigma factor (sigma-70 family)